jgi:hypothetical protein
VGREDIFKLTTGMRVYFRIIIIVVFRVADFDTSKNPVVKSMMFPLQSIHNYIWTSPD